MNETLAPERSAYAQGIRNPMEALHLISSRMLEHRPRTTLTLRAFFEQPALALQPVSQMAKLDLSLIYPHGKTGDIAYVLTNAVADRDCEAALNIAGGAEIWLNGEKIHASVLQNKPLSALTREDYCLLPVQLRKGRNLLLIKCRKAPCVWGVLLYIAYPRYPFLWTRDYLLSVRPTFPFAEMEGLEGFAHMGPLPDCAASVPLQKAVENGEVRYADTHSLPNGETVRWMPRWEKASYNDRIDLDALWGEKAGCAYALTYAETKAGCTYCLSMRASDPCRVWVDGEELHGKTFVGNGDRQTILIKTARGSGAWWLEVGVYAETDGQSMHRVPFIQNGRRTAPPWIVLGPFTSRRGNVMKLAFQPEREIQFERPYALGEEKRGFWQLPQPGVFIRPYQDGIFFGQWFYAVQVGLQGLLAAAMVDGNTEQLHYFQDSIQAMADYYAYMHWDKERFGNPTLIPRAWGLPDLDACGTIGVSMVEAYNLSGNPNLLTVIRDISDAITHRIPRMQDGTFCRVHSLWADDLYMSCPFLARLVRLTGEQKYKEEIYRQLAGFHKRLWMQDERLYAHIFFVDEKKKSGIPWGRGNGWIALAYTEILSLLPQEDPRWTKALRAFQTFVAGILVCQDACGMWHQVLNRPESYVETSCTAMFVLSLARGVQHGWLETETCLRAAEKGWKALMQYAVDEAGDVYGVCLGSSCAQNPAYYFDLPTKKNDDHGTGVILMAAAELIQARRTAQLRCDSLKTEVGTYAHV